MPDVQSLAADFRKHYRLEGVYLSTPEEVPVLVATVVGVITNPIFQISFTTVSGSHTDVHEDFEIEVLRSGAFVGRLRVAAGGATSSLLQVNEVSQTRIRVQAGDTLRVLRSVRLRDKLVAASSTFDKDSRIPYSDQNQNVPPLVVDGGHYAARWKGVPVEVPFFGSMTIPADFNSGGPFSHSYAVYGPEDFSSTDEDPVFEFEQPGTYWVKHTVTNMDNGASWTKWSVVILDENPIYVQIESLGGSVDDPQSISFRGLKNCGVDRLPPGAMMILHEDESTGSAGNRILSRSRVKGVFFLLNETARIDPQMGELTFNAVSPLGILQQLPGFSQLLEMAITPTSWQEYEVGLTVNAVIIYLLRWHTTYTNLFDVVLPELDYPYRGFEVQQQTPAAQVAEIADAVEAYVRADRAGALIIRQNLNLRDETARDAADVLYHFTSEDNILEVEELTYEHRPRVAHVLYRMFSGDQPMEAESGAPMEAPEFNTIERKIGMLQEGFETSANERCGWHIALQNHQWFGHPVARMTLRHSGSYDFLDTAYDQWVLFTGEFEVAGRVYSFNAVRFWIESVEVQYEQHTDDNGVTQWKKFVRATYIGETNGEKGVTVPVLIGDTTPIDDFEDHVLTPPTPNVGWLSAGENRIAAFSTDNYVYITENFTAETPMWTRFLLALNGNLVDFALDPHSPGLVGTGSAINGVITTDSATDPVAYIYDIFGATSQPRQITVIKSSLRSNVSTGTRDRRIETNFGLPGAAVIVSNYQNQSGSTGTWYTYSLDFNSPSPSWSTETQVSAHYETVLGNSVGGIWLSPRNPGTGIISAYTTTGAQGAAEAAFFRLSSLFSSVSQITTPSDFKPNDIASWVHVPWHDNPDESIVYFHAPVYTELAGIKRKNADGSISDVTPTISGAGLYFGSFHRRPLATSPLNRQRVATFATRSGVAANGIFVSLSAGDVWTKVTPDATTPYRSVFLAGDNQDTVFVIGLDGAIGVTYDFGATGIMDKSGNIPVDFPDAGIFVNIVGGG